MDTEFMLDVSQAHEFKLACRKANITNRDIKRLCEGDLLRQIKLVLNGQAKIEVIKCLIDLDADPMIPDGWKVEEHTKGGQFQFDLVKVSLHLDEQQKAGYIVGRELRNKLQGRPVFNANLLDYLLTHTELIPEEWKGKTVFFWGTIYRSSDGCLIVRSLGWSGGRWDWSCLWLGGRLSDDCPAAVPAS